MVRSWLWHGGWACTVHGVALLVRGGVGEDISIPECTMGQSNDLPVSQVMGYEEVVGTSLLEHISERVVAQSGLECATNPGFLWKCSKPFSWSRNASPSTPWNRAMTYQCCKSWVTKRWSGQVCRSTFPSPTWRRVSTCRQLILGRRCTLDRPVHWKLSNLIRIQRRYRRSSLSCSPLTFPCFAFAQQKPFPRQPFTHISCTATGSDVCDPKQSKSFGDGFPEGVRQSESQVFHLICGG